MTNGMTICLLSRTGRHGGETRWSPSAYLLTDTRQGTQQLSYMREHTRYHDTKCDSKKHTGTSNPGTTVCVSNDDNGHLAC